MEWTTAVDLIVHAEASGLILLGIDNPGTAARQWRKACQSAAMETLIYWIDEILPRHFGRDNWHIYPGAFFKRKESTQKKKARKWHHTAALVNYPIGQIPSDRPTLEGYLRKRLPKLHYHGAGARAVWATPGITAVYKDEATAINDVDRREQAVVFHEALQNRFGTGRLSFKAKVRRSMSREEFRRFRRIRIA